MAFSVATYALVAWAGAAPLSAGQSEPRQEATQRNSNAKSAYRVKLAFQALPIEIAPPAVSAFYKVQNLDCVATDMTRAPGGIRLAPEHALPLTVSKIGDGVYTATLYTDAVLNSDLFGQGVCQWKFESVGISFRTPKAEFVATLWADTLVNGTPVTRHYLVRDLADPPPVYDKIFGEKPGHYLLKMGPQFTLTMSAQSMSNVPAAQ